jgi:hypothetical protein
MNTLCVSSFSNLAIVLFEQQNLESIASAARLLAGMHIVFHAGILATV